MLLQPIPMGDPTGVPCQDWSVPPSGRCAPFGATFHFAVPGFLTPRRQALRTCSIAHDVSPIYQQCGDVQSRGVLVEWVDCSTICMSAVAAVFSQGWPILDDSSILPKVLSTKFRPLFSFACGNVVLEVHIKTYFSKSRPKGCGSMIGLRSTTMNNSCGNMRSSGQY